jgi:hypothetical protein
MLTFCIISYIIRKYLLTIWSEHNYIQLCSDHIVNTYFLIVRTIDQHSGDVSPQSCNIILGTPGKKKF